jgi:ABC-type dipeptide/oligopeptide/nickel transport system permease subunit
MASADARITLRAAEASVESLPRINPPGQWTLFWRRFKRDRFALGSLIVFVLLVLLCFVGEPLIGRALGHGPNEPFPFANGEALRPVGPWTHVRDATSTSEALATHKTTVFVLGSDGRLGRDEFIRLLKGGQTSLEIGLGSTFLALLIGVPLGALAGLIGGWTDAGVSRLTEFFMGFPILLLLAALGYSVRTRLEAVTLHHAFAPGVLSLILLIGLFSWFYPARIVRSVVLQLRRQDFIDAARMIGASTPRIVRTHIVPHLIGPIAVYFAIICAANIVLESAISFLNIGVPLPDASWGNMLAENWGHFFIVDQPGSSTGGIITSNWTTVLPAAVIALTVLCLALIGEGVREAFDPGSRTKAARL